MNTQSATRTKFIDLLETLPVMEENDELKIYVRDTLKYLIETYRKTNGNMSQEAFSDKAGIGWKSIDNILTLKHWPGIDTLDTIVRAADSDLADFFSRVVSRTRLQVIAEAVTEEREVIATLVRGLASPKTAPLVRSVSRHVAEMLQMVTMSRPDSRVG